MATKQEQEPASTEVDEVAPGILRMQLPIQMPGLGHVNMYAIEDDRGLAVVDPGLPGPLTWRAIRNRFKEAGLPLRRVHTVVVTHSHPDHFGTARRLAHETDADIVTHAAFRMWFRPHSHADGADQPAGDDDALHVPDVDPSELLPAGEATVTFGGPTPWGGHSFRPALRRRAAYALMRRGMGGRFAPPTPTRRLRDGDPIRLARRDMFAVHSPGHTLDHLCLHDPEGGVLLSGDHVLPTITPHISGLGSGRDPLKLYVESLDKVAALEGVTTVLPAHGHPFTDLEQRVDAIKEHHAGRLGKLREASLRLGPATVEDLSHELFRVRSWGPMAESETYAHLEHLRLLGQAQRHDREGKLVYEVTGGD